MKVILQQNIQKLGKAGDVVEASAGYFRNFLQPRKLAVQATEGAMKKLEEDLEVLRRKAEAAHQEMVNLAEKIQGMGSVKIAVKVGEGGKLYGKITNKEIAQVIKNELGQEIDKRVIRADDIAALGIFKAQIKLASDVQTDVVVEVYPEGGQPPSVLQAAKAAASVPAESVEVGAEA